MHRYMYVKKKQLDLVEIEKDIREKQARISELSKKFEQGGKDDLFIGVAIAIVQTEAN